MAVISLGLAIIFLLIVSGSVYFFGLPIAILVVLLMFTGVYALIEEKD